MFGIVAKKLNISCAGGDLTAESKMSVSGDKDHLSKASSESSRADLEKGDVDAEREHAQEHEAVFDDKVRTPAQPGGARPTKHTRSTTQAKMTSLQTLRGTCRGRAAGRAEFSLRSIR